MRNHRQPERNSFRQKSSRHFEWRSEEHTSELQSLRHLVCRLLLVKKENTFVLQSVRLFVYSFRLDKIILRLSLSRIIEHWCRTLKLPLARNNYTSSNKT